MKDTYTSDNSRDFRQRYAGTYGRLTTPTGKKITVYVEDMDDNEVRCLTAEGAQISARVNAGVEFEFYPLNRRLTDHQGSILYSERKAARQYQRGVCLGNTYIVNMSKMKEVRLDHGIVDAIYNQEQNPAETFSDYVKGTRNSFLLSNMFAVIEDKLYLYSKVVGNYKKATATLSVIPLFCQEVKDAISRNNLATKMKVEVNDQL